MPERNLEFGKYGARGIRGSEAIARQLDRLVGYIRTPITQARGLRARLAYITGSKARREQAIAAGLTPKSLSAWQRGVRKPNRASLQRIEETYRAMRRRNVQRDLIRRLNRGGRGTQVEFHPVNQSAVRQSHVRPVEMRRLNIRRWDDMVRAWAEDNDDQLHDAYIDQITDLGSQWGQYEYVTNVGFAA